MADGNLEGSASGQHIAAPVPGEFGSAATVADPGEVGGGDGGSPSKAVASAAGGAASTAPAAGSSVEVAGHDAHQAGDAAAAVKVGQLTKKGEKAGIFGGKSWKKRWFRLSDGIMTYHADASQARAGYKPLRQNRVGLWDFLILPSEVDPLAFTLTPLAANYPREWELKADTAEERDEWIHAFVAHGCQTDQDLERMRQDMGR